VTGFFLSAQKISVAAEADERHKTPGRVAQIYRLSLIYTLHNQGIALKSHHKLVWLRRT